MVLAALGTAAGAQQRPVRLGFLGPIGGPGNRSLTNAALVRRLAELGYVEGKSAFFEERSAAGDPARLPALARELAQLKLDLIFAWGPLAVARAMVDAKPAAPIILSAPDYDPVETSIVRSYRRPGVAVTGAYIAQPLLAVKRFELARQILPSADRFLVFSDEFARDQRLALQKAVGTTIKLELVEFRAPPYDYEAAFEQGRRARTQALIGLHSPLFYQDRAKMAELAARYKLPALGSLAEFADAGYLATYGASNAKIAERAAEIAVRVLKGADPAATPVEQVNEYELVINLKTAKALGLKVPGQTLVRATRIIEEKL